MKSSAVEAFYLPEGRGADGRERFLSTPATGGPWSAEAQHGGPPAALLGRALEALEPGLDRVLGRFAMDLLGPVPLGPVSLEARVLRAGRSVSLREAVLYDEQRDRPVAVGRAWALPRAEDGPVTEDAAPAQGPAEGRHEDVPGSWHRGYLDAIEWRWLAGSIDRPGRGLVWMRLRLPLVAGEEPTPWQRLLCCVDSASGVSAALDTRAWAFQNTELTVHVMRPPTGEWVLLDAVTELTGTAVGLATSRISDADGPVGRSSQALLVVPAR
ncbi:MAG: thioesterase family protein [Marmoricola sp.]